NAPLKFRHLYCSVKRVSIREVCLLRKQTMSALSWHQQAKEKLGMNILLAIDSSASSEAAVSAVIARPWPKVSKVCALHVLDLFALPSAHTGAGSFIEVEIEAAQSFVKSAA